MAAPYRARAAYRKRGALDYAADLIWPPRSLLSERILAAPGAIEPELWGELSFLTDPLCFRCGFPLTEHLGAQAICAACAADPPVFARARAALAYDDHARKLVLELKRAGRRDGLPAFAAWMREAAAPLLAETDLIAPTPMHWTRLAMRSFNQAAWLAQALARAAGKPWAPELLVRAKRRRSQEGLSASERRANVAGAIRVSRINAHRAREKVVLLVDDVFTTGATLEACARALYRAGAAKVHAVALARVVRPLDATI